MATLKVRKYKWLGLDAVLTEALARPEYQLSPNEGVQPNGYMCDIVHMCYIEVTKEYNLYNKLWQALSAGNHRSLGDMLYSQDVIEFRIQTFGQQAVRIEIGRVFWGAVRDAIARRANLTSIRNAGYKAVRDYIDTPNGGTLC